MARTTSKNPDGHAEQLAAEIESMSAEILKEVAVILDSTPDKELFGDTEFVVRDKILKIVAQAYTARLAQKKTDTSVRPSLVPTVVDPRNSRGTDTESR
jgi:hypothetical protein